jgi:hypothetical protein
VLVEYRQLLNVVYLGPVQPDMSPKPPTQEGLFEDPPAGVCPAECFFTERATRSRGAASPTFSQLHIAQQFLYQDNH